MGFFHLAKFYTELTDALINFIRQQHIFFTATAPDQGRINLSPKGMNTFRCINPQEVAYLDLTGSGNETSAHLLQNGRLTIMFCSFAAEPLILRLYGTGTVLRPRDPDWLRWIEHFDELPGCRQIVALRIESVQTSCGFAVPLYDFNQERPTLNEWATKKGEQGIYQYWQQKNQISIDGLQTALLSDDGMH
jgi:hypothetical protein